MSEGGEGVPLEESVAVVTNPEKPPIYGMNSAPGKHDTPRAKAHGLFPHTSLA